MTKLFEMKPDGQIVMNITAHDMLRIIEQMSLRFIEPAIMTGQRLNVGKTVAFFRAEVNRAYVGELEELRPIFADVYPPEEVAKVFDSQAAALSSEIYRFFDVTFLGEGEKNISVMVGKINKTLEKAAVDSRSLGIQELFEPIPKEA